ncbi:MAG: tyrosine--tRNA ligase, partial [Coriobacteriales bacterium]|nr:tyrosine--tRNA ligase [Coriobacteriales bacterium]
KRSLARNIVSAYHDEAAATAAEAAFDRLFKAKETPEQMPEHSLASLPSVAEKDGAYHLPAVLVALGFAASNSEARRLIDGGGVRVAGNVVQKGDYDLPTTAFAAGAGGTVVQSGKRRFARLISD